MDSKFGICVCGLNGSGKTTLAHALAKELNYKHMDIEDYYFTPSDNPYSSSRTHEQALQLLYEDIQKNPCFVFSAVSGDMTPEINETYDLVVYLYAPTDVRMKRIKQRTLDKFGERALPGGDVYEQEERFFEFALRRKADPIEVWLDTLSCKVVRLNGESCLFDNVQRIKDFLRQYEASLV